MIRQPQRLKRPHPQLVGRHAAPLQRIASGGWFDSQPGDQEPRGRRRSLRRGPGRTLRGLHRLGLGLKLDETVESFERVANGEFDHLPEQAFYLVGTVAEAIEKAEKMKSA